MNARFLLFTLAVGVGAVTACGGAEDTGLFAPGDDTSGGGGGTDSGSTPDSAPDSTTPIRDGGTGTDTGVTQPPDSSTSVDATPPPHDSAPPPVDSAPPDPGVQCSAAPSGYCDVPSESCCIAGLGTSVTPVGTCSQSGDCFTGVEVPCDNAAECDEIDPGQGEVCCGTTDQAGVTTNVACAAPSDCTDQTNVILCDPTDTNPCPQGTTCRKSTRTLPNYYLCLN
jgi:hypothetical protein